MICKHDGCTQYAVANTRWCAEHQPGRTTTRQRILAALEACEGCCLDDPDDRAAVASVVYDALYGTVHLRGSTGDDEAGGFPRDVMGQGHG